MADPFVVSTPESFIGRSEATVHLPSIHDTILVGPHAVTNADLLLQAPIAEAVNDRYALRSRSIRDNNPSSSPEAGFEQSPTLSPHHINVEGDDSLATLFAQTAIGMYLA